jgi:predicted short-subunit dehydrogenase-like oxidoreductase (DUF2520 family)
MGSPRGEPYHFTKQRKIAGSYGKYRGHPHELPHTMTAHLRVFVFGAGKVGRALARAIRDAGGTATLRAARAGIPNKRILADLLLLCVRDKDLAPLARDLAASGTVPARAACVHVAGGLGPEPLDALRPVCAGVGQMHPMISFASTTSFPNLARGQVHVQGDAVAVRRARALARMLGMSPRTIPKLDTVGYHAAAGLVANGAAALAAVGAELLVRPGVPRPVAAKMLGPLLRSVAENVERLGFPAALTGPVRRGDAGAIARHAALLRARLPEAVPLFLAAGLAQVPLARAIGDAPEEAFDHVERALREALRT